MIRSPSPSIRLALVGLVAAAFPASAHAARWTVSGTAGSTVAEGTSASIVLTASTASAPATCTATPLYEWSTDGGGVWSTPSATATFTTTVSATTVDGPGTVTAAKVRVSDAGGTGTCTDSADATVTATVTNTAPVVTVTGSATATEGGTVAYTCAATDPMDSASLTYAWTFPDGGSTTYNATRTVATHTFAQTGGTSSTTTTVTCTVDDGDDTGSGTRSVAVANANPTVTLPASFSGNEGSAISFSATVSDPGGDTPLAYLWSFGDGDTSTATAPSHTYTANATYTVTLLVTDPDGGSTTSTSTVTVANVAPTVAVTGSATANEGAAVAYTCTPTDPADTSFTYTWTFSDSGTTVLSSGDSVATHTWAQTGGTASTSSTARCVVSDGTGTGTDTRTVTVANVSPSVTLGSFTGNEGSAVALSATVSDAGGDTLTYAWDFGESTLSSDTSTATAPSHTYANDGTYTVTLTVTDPDTGSTTRTGTVTIASVAPVATISASPSSGTTSANEGATVVYTCAATDAADTSFTYTWAFSDTGTTVLSSGNSVATHTWAQTGGTSTSSTARCTVSDGTSTGSDTETLTVSNVNPTVTLGTYTGDEGTAIPFSATVADAGSDTLTYAWNFGDASSATNTSTAAAPSHTYAAEGSYTVTLTVSDGDGGTASATRAVTVSNVAPAPTISASPTSGTTSATEGAVVVYTCAPNDASDASFTYTWAFSDTGTTTYSTSGNVATHTWKQTGGSATTASTVSCTVDDGTESGSTSRTVTVSNASPTVTLGTFSGSEGTAVAFSATVADAGGDTLTYAWNFGDPSSATNTSSATAPSHTFAADGTYTVTLTVTDPDGGTATATRSVVISNVAPTVALAASPTTGLSAAFEGDSVAYTCTATDPSDTVFTYTWAFSDAGTTVLSSGDRIATHSWKQSGGSSTTASTVRCTVNDGSGSAAASTTVTVTNKAPVVTLGSTSGAEGVAITFAATVVDPGSDTPLAYAWEFGDGATSTATSPSHTYTSDGTYTAALTVTDADGGVSTRATATVTISNTAPVVSVTSSPSSGTTRADEGDVVVYTCGATDPADTSFTYAWAFTDTGATVLSSGDSVATHTWRQAGGASTSYAVTCTVGDGVDTAAATVSVLTTNLAPEIAASPTPGATASDAAPYTFTPTASDPGADTFSWSYTGLSSAVGPVTFDTSTGKLTWSASYRDVGSFDVTITATDTDGGTDSLAWTIIVSAVDTDGDGLSDGEEENLYFTDPLLPDTDGDGLDDGDEVAAASDPNDGDSDDDGLLDGDEIDLGTDPLDADSDDDGLSDGDEVNTWFTDPLDADSDDDGLSDGDEALEYGTDPNAFDTDGDGLSDAEDVDTYATDPLNPDDDGDGLTDGEEVFTWGTDPLDADSDDDSLTDGFEVDNGADPLNADDDSDGVPTLLEYDADGVTGQDDTDGDSVPDYLDTDDDGDSVPTADERDVDGDGARDDTDGDSILDYRDEDDDDDGQETRVEVADLDVDADGLVGTSELEADTDADGCWNSDLDCDGIPGHRDDDDDGDGIPTVYERGDGTVAIDTDCDTLEDFLDADDDADSVTTAVELALAGLPMDADGRLTVDPTTYDGDADGVLDLDADDDGLLDSLDADDDADGVPTALEAARLDTDGDGTVSLDELTADTDADGCLDADADCDDVYDHWDTDADSDSVLDGGEYTSVVDGTIDACGDTVTDWSGQDTDGDGLDDAIDDNDDGDTTPTADEAGLDTDGDGISDALENDDDGDGYTDLEGSPEDCDDLEASIYPGATEVVDDGVDQDCADGDTCYVDADSDNYRSEDTTATVASEDADCDDPGEGTTDEPATDCDDTDDTILPFAIDTCETFGTEQVDQDCNGDVSTYVDRDGVVHNSVPEGGEFPFYIDQDHDGYGDADATPIYPCEEPDEPTDAEKAEGVASYSPTNGDCNDANPYVHPGAEELCNGVDEDCDDEADDADSLGENSGCRDLFADHDADGYGSTDEADQLCLCYDGAPDDVDVGGPTDVGGPDADDDGLSDVDEAGYYGTDPADPDSDGDGLSDGDEALLEGSDPLVADTDGDGLEDLYEVDTTFTDPTLADTDADGLDDGAEEALGTNPLLEDSDDGGTADGVELADGTDPMEKTDDVSDVVDTDADGLTDREEAVFGSDPTLTDTDEDGLVDSVEAQRGTSPIAADTDGGGTSDGDEETQGTDALDASDDVRFEASACPGVDAGGEGYEVTSDGTCWTAQTGDCYDYDSDINPGAVERIDGDDNNCDGSVPSVELDCDEDGSLALDPDLLSLPTTDDYDAAALGLPDCTVGSEYPLSCFSGESVRLTCDRSTLLWVASRADDVMSTRYNGGKRLYADGRTCTTDGDCDDNCSSRCPDAAEVCDGVDNDCDAAGIVVDEDGDAVLDAMQVALEHPGFVSADEVDLDGDGFVACEGLPTGAQVYPTLESCDTTIVDNALFGDCNDTCSLARPDATEERCDGLLDICNGAAEGADADGDGFATCGAHSGTDGSAIVEDVYLVVWYTPGTGGDADTGDTGAPADTGEGTVGTVVPLLLPRLEAPDCDATLETEVAAVVGADHLEAAVFAASDERPADAVAPLLAACIQAELSDSASRCAVARITLDAAAEAGLDDDDVNPTASFDSTCADHPEQQTLRTVWSRERILQSRRLVEEWECYRLSGTFGCGDASPEGYWESLPDFTEATSPGGSFSNTVPDDALLADTRWWQELTRFSPVAATTGILSGCWEEDDTDETTGGDCADGASTANREGVEGPADLLVTFYGLDPECDSCLDGVDNNCNQLVDCEEPACAACFAGNGLGCASSDSPCGQSGCAASGSSLRTGPFSGLMASLTLLVLAAASRRRA